jgi:hypothetical protein
LSQAAFNALAIALLAALLTVSSVLGLQSGHAQGLVHDKVDRRKNPGYFWCAWALWTALAVFAWWHAGTRGWEAWTEPAPVPVAFGAWAPWGATLLVVGLFLAWFFVPVRWHRRGNWWTHRAEYRREKALRALLKQLTADRLTGDDDDTLDDVVDWSDLDWLEQLAINLAAQAPPRRLRLAIEATPEPEFEEEDEEEGHA